ncbi:MAG: DUF255 domain-containing protein [Firmicutes bacterium]|nr:thioredoxin domain-containing protein [Alicyclobacillaceae bacterium]MCL6496966.1 DUF255 domain-containing protein [Bacillota bacterium]
MAEVVFRFSPRPNRAAEIPWQPFSPEVFAQAEAEGKLVLLSISAVWCHWCHVMDETTYSDDAVIARLSRDFIPVRVDNDQRPDVNLRYNLGGWPTTAVLTPRGEILAGGTYLNPEQLLSLLDQAQAYWQEHREEVLAAQNPPAPVPLKRDATQPQPAAVNQVVEAIRQQFDRAYGGLGLQPKFPLPDVWHLCLQHYLTVGDSPAAGMAIRTLDAMAGSRLFDPVAGGFFRYSTTREWTVPHYEKMLEDNAQLAIVYLRAFQILADEAYRQVANAVLTWANRTLITPEGLWGGSQDADEAYYQQDPEARQKLTPPRVDPVIHTNANAWMVSAQLLAAALINPGVYAPTAFTALEALWDRMWDPERGLYHYDDGTPSLPGLLVDVAALANALLDGYEYSGDPIFVERATALLHWADQHLYDGTAYYDQIEDPSRQAGRLQYRQHPLADNAAMARFLWRLGLIQEDTALITRAQALLGAFEEFAAAQGVFGAPWALVAEGINTPLLSLTVVESDHRPGHTLRQAAAAVYAPNRLLRTVKQGTEAFRAGGYAEVPMPALYLCRGTVCAAPITTPEGIAPALQRLLQAEVNAPTSPT